MKRKKNHKTTKNTVSKVAKPPISKLAVIEGDCNGAFKIVTDFITPKETETFQALYKEWFDSPLTKRWHIDDFIGFFKRRHPNRICVTHDDFDNITKDSWTPATKEEYESENN